MSRNAFLPLVCVAMSLAVPAAATAPTCSSVTYSLEQTWSGYSQYVHYLQPVDYNHDGNLDLVGGIDGAGGWTTLYEWEGLGNGTFNAPVSLGDSMLMDVQVINVNNDGYADIVASTFDFKIIVRLGNATGFDAPIVNYLNYVAYDIQAGNFNEGTGNIDLVTASLGSGIFVVYEGNGNGTFTETRRVSVAQSNWITDTAVADFDNDGRFDVALARRHTQQIEVYFRNEDGAFASPVVMNTGEYPDELIAADFNEDGLSDLVWDNWTDGTIELRTSGAAASHRIRV